MQPDRTAALMMEAAEIAAERSPERAYERAIAREIQVYDDAAISWQFQLVFAGAPLGVLVGADRATLFPGVMTSMFQAGVTLLLAAACSAAIGYMIVLNAKSALTSRLARALIADGRLTHAAAQDLLRRRHATLPLVTVMAVVYFAALFAAAALLLIETGLIYLPAPFDV